MYIGRDNAPIVTIGSKRMHGPLICYECRIFLKEDEAHEKEQQAYEDRRQAKYKAQLEGDTVVTKTDKEESTKEEQEPYDGHTYEVVKSPSPPRDLPQNFTRITLAQVFILGLQDEKVFKTARKDGQVLTQRTQPIPLHLNRFACLTEIQDPSPIQRWSARTLQFHIVYLQQRQATKKQTSGQGNSLITLLNHKDPQAPKTFQENHQVQHSGLTTFQTTIQTTRYNNPCTKENR
jgi:hypothetical protein